LLPLAAMHIEARWAIYWLSPALVLFWEKPMCLQNRFRHLSFWGPNRSRPCSSWKRIEEHGLYAPMPSLHTMPDTSAIQWPTSTVASGTTPKRHGVDGETTATKQWLDCSVSLGWRGR